VLLLVWALQIYLETDVEYIIFQAIETCEDAMAEACTYTQERRGWERLNVAYTVTIRSSRGLVEGETKNVSGTGALISSSKPLFPGETCDLILWPPSDAPIETLVRVVWSRLDDLNWKTGPWEAGVRFL
jgi:hypothetical protein